MSTQLKALIIDDSEIMRKLVMKSLNDAKVAEFEFVEAEDGQAALQKMKAGQFDIAFVDWNMPKMTGIEFVIAVRKEEKMSCENYRIPLVMVTSEKTLSKIQTALVRAGADLFLSKPFSVEDLQVRLKNQVEKAALIKRRMREKDEQTPAKSASSHAAEWLTCNRTNHSFSKIFRKRRSMRHRATSEYMP